jgi:hypothetical protein
VTDFRFELDEVQGEPKNLDNPKEVLQTNGAVLKRQSHISRLLLTKDETVHLLLLSRVFVNVFIMLF